MKRTILHVFHVGNNLESVKHALNSLEGLASWWTNTVTGNPSVGGIIEFRFADVFKPDMKVIASNDALIQWQCVAGEKDWANDIFTFAFNDKGTSATLTFRQEYTNEITDKQYGTFNFNWGYYLNSLKLFCETGKGMPWYNKSTN